MNRFQFSLALAIALLVGCTPIDTEVPEDPENSSSLKLPPVHSKQFIDRATPVAAPPKPDRPLTVPPDSPDPQVQKQIEQFLNGLASQGFPAENHGVWMQTEDALLANYQGTKPISAASVTKVATALAALTILRPEHQFITEVGIVGKIADGVLEGDLVVNSEGDPFIRWEEAIAFGNLLNQLGIQRVTGDLIVNDKFYMNFCPNSFDPCPLSPGEYLFEGLDERLWTAEVLQQYQKLPPGTPRPQVAIEGTVRVESQIPEGVKPLIRHYSPPLVEQVKLMNRYSNNMVAEALAQAVGGAKVVAQTAAETTGIPPEEIQLVNGSGYAEENRMSPRAAVALFLALQNNFQAYNLSVADMVAVVGTDEGILDSRSLPAFAVVKSGSLNNVSTIAGALPTQIRGTVWLAIFNGGNNMEGFRAAQDALLNDLVKRWGAVSGSPAELTPITNPIAKQARTELVQ
ncbi:MAG TPA: D-alanyl-D-alanine carboxypeptidase [Oscillatoriales cyanobacterium M59_W2019_021]|nr:MAG: D-alanyl-D-alanine carboxypeptidase [Cyanobacteria bacterium J055]HIK32198.1 D-alanyl-D-alanine carboxypeptidase [Oscillatoriales cyanobacterium M4454_W2019_049]HIK50876.1 D-alanyl-D-alanine carboxypeptidase [Oscillatoriales cyanobacterium M59_W2019_021]